HLVVSRTLLINAENRRLHRRVARLDQVARALRVRWKPVGYRDNQRVAARAEAQIERAGVDEHPVAWLRAAGQVRVSQRAHENPGDGDLEFHRAAPLPPEGGDLTATPLDHNLTLTACENRYAPCPEGVDNTPCARLSTVPSMAGTGSVG